MLLGNESLRAESPGMFFQDRCVPQVLSTAAGQMFVYGGLSAGPSITSVCHRRNPRADGFSAEQEIPLKFLFLVFVINAYRHSKKEEN